MNQFLFNEINTEGHMICDTISVYKLNFTQIYEIFFEEKEEKLKLRPEMDKS